MKYRYLVIFEYAHDENGKPIKNPVTQFTIKQSDKAEKFRKELQDDNDLMYSDPKNQCGSQWDFGRGVKFKISRTTKKYF